MDITDIDVIRLPADSGERAALGYDGTAPRYVIQLDGEWIADALDLDQAADVVEVRTGIRPEWHRAASGTSACRWVTAADSETL